MRGEIRVKRDDSTRWVYIPKKHIRLLPCVGTKPGVIISYSTNGLCNGGEGDIIPTSQWFTRVSQFRGTLEVTEEIANFGVEVDEALPDLGEGAEKIFEHLVENYLQGNLTQEVLRERFDKYLPNRAEREREHRLASELQQLLRKKGLH